MKVYRRLAELTIHDHVGNFFSFASFIKVLQTSLTMGKSNKVLVCGSSGVGKTAILEQLLYGNHTVGSVSIMEELNAGRDILHNNLFKAMHELAFGHERKFQEQIV